MSDLGSEIGFPRFRMRPRLTAVDCIHRHGGLRRIVIGVGAWRWHPGLHPPQDKRWEPQGGIIREFWASILGRPPWQKFATPSEFMRLWMLCFACGRTDALQRAHILPRSYGGTDEAFNLHMLCPKCHVESENLLGIEYWRWFKSKPSEVTRWRNAAFQYLEEEIARFNAARTR